MSLLSRLATLLTLFTKLLDLWREYRLRQGVRAEIENERLKKEEEARNQANEIDKDVGSSDLDSLRDRMRQYQRD